MSPLSALAWARWRVARHTVAAVRRESRLKVAFVSAGAAGLWLLLFAGARLGFSLFRDLGAETLAARFTVADLVMARLLSLFALALLAMLLFSNVVVAFATLYRAREVPFLLRAPLPTATFFLGRFAECVVLSSWASAYLGSPLLLAYGLETGAPPVFYAAVVAFFVPFVALPAAVACLVVVLAVPYVARLRRAHWLALGAAAALAVFGLFRERLRLPDLASAGGIQALVEALGRTQSPYLPSHWLARGVLAAATGEVGDAVFHLLLLASWAAMLLYLATLAAERSFHRGYSALAGGEGGGTGPRRRARAGFGLEALLRPLPQPWRALVAKDVRVFWRDATQWGQFLLLFGVLALYVANLGATGAGFADREVFRAVATLLNMAAALLVLASLTTRFVFPLISLEGRRFWILGLAPLDLRTLVLQKVGLSVATTAVLTVALALVSGLRLGLSPLELTLSLVAVAAATVGLSSLAVGLGSLYPRFGEDDPARVVSGMGGTLNFLLSMVYVALLVGGQAVVLLAHRLPFWGGTVPRGLFAVAVLWILAVTAVATVLPLRLGLRHLRAADF